MKYFYIKPEVAGGLGKHSVLDHSGDTLRVSRLHYEFDGWLGDVLVESFPCFIVTDGAKQKLQSIGAAGVTFDQVEVTVSEQFEELYPDLKLPPFVWLRVHGKAGHDDFGIGPDRRLVISERALESLRQLRLSSALLADFPG